VIGDAGTALAYADAGPAPAAPPPYVVPAKEPLPRAELALRPGDAMPKKALATPKRIGRGGVVPPGIPSPDRVAIATDRKGSLVDARSGQVLAALPTEPQYVAPRAGVVTLDGKPARLVRLSDAKVLTPTIEASGRPIKDAWLAAAPHHARALALAETTDGEKLAGLASDDLETFEMTRAPLDRRTTRYSGILNAIDWQLVSSAPKAFGFETAGTPFTFPHEPECLRARVDDHGAITCLEHQPHVGMGEHVRWMDGGWFSAGTIASHVSWGSRKISLADGDRCMSRAQRTSPPRSVVTCHMGREAILWAPGKIFTFAAPQDPNDIGGLIGADAGPVLPIVEAGPRTDDISSRMAGRWLDLPGTRLYTTPRLRPLAIAAFAGVESLTLAEDKQDKASSVYLLDFEKGTRELVAKVTDCPGPLGELREDRAHGRRRYLILACMTTPPYGSVAQDLVWAEIVDTEGRVRLRTTLMPEIFFPDGVVVLSSRRRLSAESKTAPGELFSADLTR
jgi:hypothetical protein